MSHHICQDLNKPSIIVTEFLDCDISLDIVTYFSQVVARSLAASMEEKHQMKQRVKK